MAYATAVKSFKTFLLLNNITKSMVSLPEISEDIIIMYIAYCHKTLCIRYDTIKLYLSGIRFEYLKRGTKCPLIKSDFSTTRITTFLNAVKRNRDTRKRQRHPITATVLTKMCTMLDCGYKSPYVDSLLKAVCITSFFGFLRCGEVTISQNEFNPAKNICLIDIKFCDTHIQLHLKSSKTDPFKQGVTIPLFKTESNKQLCPYRALAGYLEKRNKKFPNKSACTSPFFLRENGETISRSYFLGHVKHILACLGYDNACFSGHSFRIGAATSGAFARLEDHVIQTLGRWSSNCYKTYIQTPKQVIQNAQYALLKEIEEL